MDRVDIEVENGEERVQEMDEYRLFTDSSDKGIGFDHDQINVGYLHKTILQETRCNESKKKWYDDDIECWMNFDKCGNDDKILKIDILPKLRYQEDSYGIIFYQKICWQSRQNTMIIIGSFRAQSTNIDEEKRQAVHDLHSEDRSNSDIDTARRAVTSLFDDNINSKLDT